MRSRSGSIGRSPAPDPVEPTTLAFDLDRLQPGADLRGVDLRTVDFASVDLTGANFAGTNLSEAEIAGAFARRGRLQRGRIFGALGSPNRY